MMYPFADSYKTDSQPSWQSDPYNGMVSQGFSPESVHSGYNHGTPDSTDSSYSTTPATPAATYQQNGGFYSANGYTSIQDQQAPNFYQQPQYYGNDPYYAMNNGGRMDPQQQQHFSNQRQSASEYYHQSGVMPFSQQQQQQQQMHYDYMPYQSNTSSWPSQFNAGQMNVRHQLQLHQQHLRQQQQQNYSKAEHLYSPTLKCETFDRTHLQQQQHNLETGLKSGKKEISNNFYFDNNYVPEMQGDDIGSSTISKSGVSAGGGRLPPMPQFGFTSTTSTSSSSTSSATTEPSFNLNQSSSPASPNFLQFSPLSDLKPVKATATSAASAATPPSSAAAEQVKEKKKSRAATKRMLNRFNGMTEEEVAQRGLPDYLRDGLDIVFIGINPSMFAAYTGRYYDGPGNHFWQALHMAGLVPTPMSAEDDHRMLDLGIGFTNIVARTTRGLSDLTRAEIAEGAKILREKLSRHKPKIAVFNGKAIFEVYSGQKKFMFGRQPEPMTFSDSGEKTWLWVMPSSSARCAQLPRAVDKVPFFDALRKFRDHLTGKISNLDSSEIVFANVSLRNQPRKLKTEMEQQNQQHYQNHHNQQLQQHHQPTYLSSIPDSFTPTSIMMKPNEMKRHHQQEQQQLSTTTVKCDWQDDDEADDYARLDEAMDGTPAKVPRSVDAVIDYVIQKYGVESGSPVQHQRSFVGTSSEEENDLDFKDEDSNGIGELSFKEEIEDQS